jgi:hypothetical protein
MSAMYNPVVGRFLQQDPSGFAPGDPNLYRYVGNDAINMVDWSGLEGQRPGHKLTPVDPRKEGDKNPIPYDNKLVDRAIPFGSCGATISAAFERWSADDSVNTATKGFMAFTVTLGQKATEADKALLKKTHWLQLVKLDRYKDEAGKVRDNDGKYPRVIRPTDDAKKEDFINTKANFGTWSLDGDVKGSPWVTDYKGAVYWRTDTSLTFWDAPSALTQVDKDHPLVIQNYELYLIVDGQAAYVINWVVYNRWNQGNSRILGDVSGGRIPTTLPVFLSDPNGKLSRGSAPFGTRNPDITNPITGVVKPRL